MERGQFGWEKDDENEDDELNMLEASGKSHIIFLIDASKPMHVVEEGTSSSAFHGTIQCLINYLTKKVKNGDHDEIGVIFYGTRESKSKNIFPNLYTFLPIDKPDVDQILKLHTLLDESEFESLIGSSSMYSLFDSLSECAVSLKRVPKKVKRFVFLVSNEDNPCHDNHDAFYKAHLKATDFVPLLIGLEIFGIERNGSFIYEKFYRKLTFFSYPDEDEQDFKAISLQNNFRDLSAVFQTKEFSKRNAFSVPFTINGFITIGVKGFNLLLEKKKSAYVYLERKSGTAVSSKVSYVSESTGKLLKEWNFYFDLGGKDVIFSKEEVSSMKSGGNPGMQLLGFRDLDELKPKFNLKHSIFMVPDDTQVKGSSSFFAHLLEAVHSRHRFVICSFVARKGVPAKLVALIPQLASFDEIRGIETAAGFNLIFLPFAEEIRSIECAVLEPDRSFIDAAHLLIDSASSHFDFDSISNPVLARHFSLVNKIALDEERMDVTPDSTEPDYQKLFEQSSSFIKSFNELLVSSVGDEAPVVVEKKRASAFKREGGVKKAKNESVPPSFEELRAAIEANLLKKLTVDKLVAFLASENQRVLSKKKTDLLAQVESFIASKQSD